MSSRLDRHDYELNKNNSRVVRNQELYQKIYEENSYFSNIEKPTNIERTNEIDIEKVRELLKSRENYRKEIKMRELNIIKPKEEEITEVEHTEEKNYDINDYLNKAASERDVEPYHKLDVEVTTVASDDETEEVIEKDDKTSIDALRNMGNTELSLNMFDNLADDSDESVYEEETDEEETKSSIEEIENTGDNTFFTDSIKIHLSDQENEEEEGTSIVVKIVMIILVIVIIALVAFLLFM